MKFDTKSVARKFRILAVFLAALMLMSSFIACSAPEEETETESATETVAVTETEKETEDPRQSVEDGIPEGTSFSNQAHNAVTFFTRDDKDLWKYEMDNDEIRNDTLYDAIYARNRKIEERIGVEIKTIQQNGVVSKVSAWNQTLRNTVNTKSGDFEAAAFYLSQSSALALEGMYYNVADFPHIDLDKPWWNQNIRDELTLFDALFFLAGDIAISQVASGFAVFYNKDLFTKNYSAADTDLYQLVRDGEWTIDKMYELVEPVWEDSNSSGTIDDGDVIGFSVGDVSSEKDGGMDSWVAAMGISLTTMVDGIPQLSFYSERTVSAFEKVKALHLDNPSALGGSRTETNFANGTVLFHRSMLNNGSTLRDVQFNYGVLPLPKYDEDQENYGTNCENTASMIAVLSSCESDKVDMVGATLELMAAGSYKEVTPAYYEIALKSKYSNAPDDAEMYDLILNTFSFSFGYCYSSVSLAAVGSLFRNLTRDFAQAYESSRTKYENALETLITKLEDAAFNSQN